MAHLRKLRLQCFLKGLTPRRKGSRRRCEIGELEMPISNPRPSFRRWITAADRADARCVAVLLSSRLSAVFRRAVARNAATANWTNLCETIPNYATLCARPPATPNCAKLIQTTLTPGLRRPFLDRCITP